MVLGLLERLSNAMLIEPVATTRFFGGEGDRSPPAYRSFSYFPRRPPVT